MAFKHLLAKSSPDPKTPTLERTLVGHTWQVLTAMEVFNEILAKDILRLIGGDIGEEIWTPAAFCTAWLHDLGKANNHFQKMLRTPGFKQGVRHETLALIVIDDLLDGWLDAFWNKQPSWIKASVLFAVGGHHLKFPDQKQRSHTEVVFLGSHPEMRDYLEIGRKQFGLPVIPLLNDRTYSLLSIGGIKKKLSLIRREIDLDFSPAQKLFIASLKSTLMVADIAGSALPPAGQNVRSWLQERLRVVLNSDHLETVVRRRIKDQSPRLFQQEVKEAITPTVLVEAGCGSGKTAAAYLWAASRAVGKRLFFCYPTTTTASEGFSGYLQEPDFEAILVHSRASADYQLLENMPAPSMSELELRALHLEALDTWPISAVVCTAHTVLGLLQNERRGICAWPSLVRSIFVFDEIHSFSPMLFRHLLKFLEVFHSASVLLMTATLPLERRTALQKACKHRGGITIITGPEDRENAKRYVLQCSTETQAFQDVREVLDDGGKVLWVCNTVARCIEFAKSAADQDMPVQPFHSRYRYRDRLARQRVVVDGFLPARPAMLAVTTQVCEMSLDLSADLLVTEFAPVAALIQRLGRLNRFENRPSAPRKALLIKPRNAMPYANKSEQELLWATVEQWMSLIADGTPQSQRDLAIAFLEVEKGSGSTEPTEESIFDWVDDPWSSVSGRHAIMEPGYSIDLVREEDIAEGKIMEMAIPMPIPKGKIWAHWRFHKKYLVAPIGTVKYDPFWGGEYASGDFNYSII